MSLDEALKDWLSSVFGDRVKFDEPMSRHTSLRVGGPAEALVAPSGLGPLADLIKWAEKLKLPWMVVGNGTNLLVRDQGIRGLVIVLTRGFDRIRRIDRSADDIRITAMAGARMQQLCKFAIQEGLAGMNFALGIPGTVGGGIRVNAGTSRGWVSDVLLAVKILLPNGTVTDVPREKIDFSYRTLVWKNGREFDRPGERIILDGTFCLKPADPEVVKQEADRVIRERQLQQPVQFPSAGCFFKNPPSGPAAGQLIEAAGLKDKQIGGAQISARHANFIINRGGATASDILTLAAMVRETVKDRFDVELETEVQVVGT